MILTNSYSFPSAKNLRDELQKLTGIRIAITSDPTKIRRKLHLRYGNSSPVKVPDTEYNSPKFIHLVSSKYRFAKMLLENGFHAPKFVQRGQPSDSDFPLLIRESLSLSAGRGIHLCKSMEDFRNKWRGGFWWVPFIPMSYELRVHILGGNIAKVFRKVATKPEGDLPIRNMARGYHYSLLLDFPQKVKAGKYTKLQSTINKLMPCISGKFFSLDVGWDKSKKEYLILEGNSASGLNSNTANMYAQFLIDEGVV